MIKQWDKAISRNISKTTVIGFWDFLLPSNLFLKLGASQKGTTSLKYQVLCKLSVPFVRGLTPLQIYQSTAVLFFSLKGVFQIYTYHFSGFPFGLLFFCLLLPVLFFHIFMFIILICFFIKTRLFFKNV